MLAVGMLGTNCVLAVCPETREAVVVDPGDDAEKILRRLGELGATVKYIVDTHGHPDHVLANADLKDATGATLAIHPLDAPLLSSQPGELMFWLPKPMRESVPDLLLNEGDEIQIGTVSLKVLHTPGHTPGHISLVTDGIAIVGDVLFFQGIGRTDFPGGSFPQLMQSIREKLLPLGDDTVVYPGHGPATTIGDERMYNPFLA
ncbi:MAG: MBL fold metallo-hydrolase [Chloroflexi bacterium]|nr:MBL fold metallo-hydrolase [Chloroflexota bacterium]